jgi:hypothetical protein
MFIQTSSKTDSFIFLRFIKKKNDGTWEKWSNGEGKTIKCGLEEIVMMLEVLKKNRKTWSTVHNFKEEKTPISVNWEGDSKVWFNVADYPKMLSFTQIEILKMLLSHILEEKIIYSTIPDANKSFSKSNSKRPSRVLEPLKDSNDGLMIKEELNRGKTVKKMEGNITGETDKALKVAIENGDDIWIPKSTIKSQYDVETTTKQIFLIDSWFLEKNNLLK